jgi:hypothetical protein
MTTAILFDFAIFKYNVLEAKKDVREIPKNDQHNNSPYDV